MSQMKLWAERHVELVLPIVYATVFLAVIVLLLDRHYPLVGSDFNYFIPRLLDSYLHYKVEGPSIQWYTPSFGAGLPAFPNPQHLQFSVPQILTLLVDPWRALKLSIGIYVLVGYASFYYCLRRVFRLHPMTCALGGVALVANGFYIQHTIIGHVGYLQYPLIGSVLLLMLYPAISPMVAGTLLGIVCSLLLHQAGFYLVVIFTLSIAIVSPMLSLLTGIGLPWRRTRSVLTIGSAVTLLLSASKMYAVFSFLNYFPRLIRDDYHKQAIDGFRGLVEQLLGQMTLGPFFFITRGSVEAVGPALRSATGASYALWELDVSLSPALLCMALMGAGHLFALFKDLQRRPITAAILLAAIWLTVSMSTAHGLPFEMVSNLPGMRSLHANVRFAAAFILPAVVLAAFMFDRVIATCSEMVRLVLSLCVTVLFIGSMVAYFAPESITPPPEFVAYRAFDIQTSLQTWKAIRDGERFVITTAANVTDADSFKFHATSIRPYEPIFGGDEALKTEINAGPILSRSDGRFNMTNPTGYVFPQANNTRAFERIAVTEEQQMNDFVSRRQPDWKLSRLQILMNWVSFAAWLGAIFIAGRWMLLR